MLNKDQLKQARLLMGLNQTQMAERLGWTTKRNIVSLERGVKEITVQTALAVECLLRRNNKFGEYEMLNELIKDVENQKNSIIALINNADKLAISITDNVCALCFKNYAVSESWDNNEFEIAFSDSSNVEVSAEDFIMYHFQFSEKALQAEEKYQDLIDELRDAQSDATNEILSA